jgi:hypothetical protein
MKHTTPPNHEDDSAFQQLRYALCALRYGIL